MIPKIMGFIITIWTVVERGRGRANSVPK